MLKLIRWTPEELEFLASNYGTHTIQWLARRLPGRTPDAIWRQANRLGLSSGYAVWTPDEVVLLRDLLARREAGDRSPSYREIAAMFPDKYFDQVYGKIKNMRHRMKKDTSPDTRTL